MPSLPSRFDSFSAVFSTAGAVAAPETPVVKLPLLTVAERTQLLDTFNATAMPYPDDRTLQSLIEEQVAAGPDRIAAVHRERRITYAALDREAGFGHREGLGLVLQMAQVGRQLGADDVGARGEELPELHVARPEFAQRRGDVRGAGRIAAKGGGDDLDRHGGGACDLQRQRHRHAARHEADAMLRQHEAGAR